MAAPPSGSRADADPDADRWPEAWPINATDRTWDVVDAADEPLADENTQRPYPFGLLDRFRRR
jgi:hypothetical protein